MLSTGLCGDHASLSIQWGAKSRWNIFWPLVLTLADGPASIMRECQRQVHYLGARLQRMADWSMEYLAVVSPRLLSHVTSCPTPTPPRWCGACGKQRTSTTVAYEHVGSFLARTGRQRNARLVGSHPSPRKKKEPNPARCQPAGPILRLSMG